ncbi:MAG: citrate/2-methylcitrate synthase [Nitrososphaerales archaeon]
MSSPQIPVHKGLEDIYVKESKICYIDGERSKLFYRGYDIDDLVKYSTFEEVSYLLLYGKLPNRKELNEFQKSIRDSYTLNPEVIKLLEIFRRDTHPMDLLRTCISYLSTFDDSPKDQSLEKNLSRVIKIIGSIPTILGTFDRIRRGKKPIEPNPKLNLASHFLYLLRGKEPKERDAKIMDTALILHAEHEMNASTFACTVTASTKSDIYSSITSGIGTLKGPLHGGANEEALRMFLEIGSIDKVKPYLDELFVKGKKVMGFGHRIYKNYDPRYRILKEIAKEMSKERGNHKLFEIALKVEEEVLKRLEKYNIYPNVDFYSGLVFYFLNIPIDFFTCVFTMGRVVGWSAHIIEYWMDNRLIRPKALYKGELNLPYKPIEQRE